MREDEKSYQQLDPLTVLGARPVIYVAASAVAIYATIATIAQWNQVDYPLFELGGLIAVGAGAILIVFWSSSLRAPFPVAVYLSVVALGILAMVLTAAAAWPGPDGVRKDWAPLACGMLLVLIAPYRPSRVNVATSLLAGIAAGFIGLLQAYELHSSEPLIVVIVMSSAPLLLLALAGAAFSVAIGDSLDRSQSTAVTAAATVASSLRSGITRAVREDRVTILSRDVMPFFGGILDRGELSEEDRRRASSIAGSIRSLMIADVDRSWLDIVVAQAMASPGRSNGSSPPIVIDQYQVAAAMTLDQRTAMRALIVALCESPGFDSAGFHIVLTSRQSRCHVLLAARFAGPLVPRRNQLAPYLAVMRIHFPDLRATVARSNVALRFSYDN